MSSPFNRSLSPAIFAMSSAAVASLTKRLHTARLYFRFPEYMPVLHLAIHTGTRTSELLRSQVGDYDAATGKLRVRHKKVRNSSAFRYVPLTPIAVAAYEKLAAGKKPGDLSCSKIKGGDFEDTRYWFVPCVKQAGLVNLTWKLATRHTARSRWVIAGVPIAAATKFLGHGVKKQSGEVAEPG